MQAIGKGLQIVSDHVEESSAEISERFHALVVAAHVGESGKGFAVVAKGVKELFNKVNKLADSLRKEMDVISKDTTKNIRGSDYCQY